MWCEILLSRLIHQIVQGQIAAGLRARNQGSYPFGLVPSEIVATGLTSLQIGAEFGSNALKLLRAEHIIDDQRGVFVELQTRGHV